MTGELALYGKHPGYGDFLFQGLGKEAEGILADWLQDVLPKVKTRLSGDWETFWDNASAIYFWFGPAILSRPFTGLMLASRDKVGRRYPLCFGVKDALLPPPVGESADLGLYEALHHHITTVAPGASGQDLLASFDLEPFMDRSWSGMEDRIWGGRPDGDAERLLKDAGPMSQLYAEMGRAHFWSVGSDARWMSHKALPNAEELAWLLGYGETPEAGET